MSPVSYTHLDVYKRQLEGWFAGQARTGYVINQAELVGHSFSMRRAVGIEDVNARASAAQTVSYTHLDV